MLGWKGCRKGSHTHYHRQHCALLLRAPGSLCWNRSPTTLGKLREWMMNEPGAQPRRDIPQTSHSRGQSPALVQENPLPSPAAATRCRWAPTERGSVASGPSRRSVLRRSGGRGPKRDLWASASLIDILQLPGTQRGGTYLWHLFIFLFRGHLFLRALQGQKDKDHVVSFLCSPAF